MYKFELMGKNQKNEYLPRLFDIMYLNLNELGESALSFEAERDEFISEVGSALEKEPRQLILCYAKSELVGFLMYYTRKDMLMLEEVQLKKEHQKTMLFYRLCKHLISLLPDNISTVEAYADIRNVTSIKLQRSFGMRKTDCKNPELYHFVGDAKSIRKRFERG